MTHPQSSCYMTNYDRSSCRLGVVHIGFGAFHRAHQAVYLDDYMNKTGDLNWGIAAVNLRPAEALNFAIQASAPEGYIVKSVSESGSVLYRRVRSHIAFADWSEVPEKAEHLLAEASVHMATITVTEGGYYLDPKGQLNKNDPLILAELKGEGTFTIYAYLRAALRRRMESGAGALSLLCCDNIRQNGLMLKASLSAYLEAFDDQELCDWVRTSVTFPCSMVDRITPRSPLDLDEEIRELFAGETIPAVMAEDFVQWVIEDDFAGSFPDLRSVGVTITDDVEPYEEAKIRILNGGHTCLTYFAALRGLKTFDQAMEDDRLVSHLKAYENNEVLPGLTLMLPFDKNAYLDRVLKRFGNKAIGDTVERICADGYSKFPIFILPTLSACLNQGRVPTSGFLSIASWYLFARHFLAGRITIDYHEPYFNALKPLLAPEAKDQFITSTQLWGHLPEDYPAFKTHLSAAIKEVEQIWPV